MDAHAFCGGPGPTLGARHPKLRGQAAGGLAFTNQQTSRGIAAAESAVGQPAVDDPVPSLNGEPQPHTLSAIKSGVGEQAFSESGPSTGDQPQHAQSTDAAIGHQPFEPQPGSLVVDQKSKRPSVVGSKRKIGIDAVVEGPGGSVNQARHITFKLATTTRDHPLIHVPA